MPGPTPDSPFHDRTPAATAPPGENAPSPLPAAIKAAQMNAAPLKQALLNQGALKQAALNQPPPPQAPLNPPALSQAPPKPPQAPVHTAALAEHAARLAFSMRLPGWAETPPAGALASLAAAMALRLTLHVEGGIGFDTAAVLQESPPGQNPEPTPEELIQALARLLRSQEDGPDRFWFG
ncbi:hypothetical protein NON00_22285 [Roseomonas sp. GC11]|uniref:hypothetical protein n=1 Tax=Roseomonas sp. GC11 TaxID=2950546 RepID=UPI00210F0CDE|nr:hypothetical protein [Roseomonas sp. GC11]MCQ4162640.1 hypothetical protein [Roseomonas sp. GC11]